MARRTIATIQRPTVHVYERDQQTPGVCGWHAANGRLCGLPERNSVHVDPDDPRLAELERAQGEHRRRIGDDL